MSMRTPFPQPQGFGLRLGAEQNTTPVAGANDTVINTTNRFYSFFTLPSTAPLFIITGIEVLNGTVVNGTFYCGVEIVDANLPTLNGSTLAAYTQFASQTGTSTTQRISALSSMIIPAGTVCGAYISSASTTGRFGTTTKGSGNRLKAIAFATANVVNNTSWTAGTEEPYIKVYYKPLS